MICNDLIHTTQLLNQIDPTPSAMDIARALCGRCDRLDRCPCLALEQVDAILELNQTKPEFNKTNVRLEEDG